MIILGCVTQINSTDITVALPNNLVGFVPITSISEQLTKKIETLLEGEESDNEGDGKAEEGQLSAACKKIDDDLTNLNNYFSIGQYIRACVVSNGEDVPQHSGRRNSTSTEHTKYKKRIELSLQPSMANAGVTVKELVVGCAIQASVQSVEDHGLIMNLGLEDKSLTGFMSSKELGPRLSLKTVYNGQVLLCTITGLSSNGKIVKLSGEVEKPVGAKQAKGGTWKGGLWLSEAPTVNAFMPGTGVELLVTDVGIAGGFRGKIMGMVDGVVDYFHGQGWREAGLQDRIKIGNKV